MSTDEQRREALRAADEAREAALKSDDVVLRRNAVYASIVARMRAAKSVAVDHNGYPIDPNLPPAA